MGVLAFTKVRGLAKSESPQTLRVLGLQTLLVLGPLQKLLLPLTFRSTVAMLPIMRVGGA